MIVKRRVTTALGLILATATVVGASASGAPAAAAAKADPHKVPVVDDAALPLSARAQSGPGPAAVSSAHCSAPAPHPVPDGRDIVVSLPPAAPFTVGRIPAKAWKSPPVTDPTWRMNWYGFMYLPPLAARAAQDHQTGSLDTMVGQVARFHTEHRDVGTIALGWDEGTSLRRLDTLSCLYALTGDKRLAEPMRINVAVLFSNRYYGPPHHSVHNHGLMANLSIVRAAQLLGNVGWKQRALARMRSEAPQAFSRSGTSWEQSSQYQKLNTDLWNHAADTLAENDPRDTTVRVIRVVTRRAATVYAWFTEPDGKLVQLGDSQRYTGSSGPLRAGVFRDDPAGVAVGRWHPTDTRTTYYTLRYGPPRRAHGHEERSGVTYTTAGVRVLVNPGFYTYDNTSPYLAYQRGQVGSNTAIPSGRRLNTRAGVAVTAAKIQWPAHGWRMTDSLYGIRHHRDVNVNHPARTLRVTDTYPAKTLYRQYWHLEPGWKLVSGGRLNSTRIVYRHTRTGRTLTITTTGRLSGIVSGATRPVGGWLFPKMRERVANQQIVIRRYGGVMTTTFVVR